MADPAPISLIASDGFISPSAFIPPPPVAETLTPGMSVTEALGAMEQAQAGPESIELISKSMDQKKLLDWGVESGKLAEAKLPAADVEALKKAEALLAEGGGLTEASGAAAAEAAAAGGFAGPGSFMAQAVALSAPAAAVGAAAAPAVSAASAAPLAGAALAAPAPLVASTVQGSVMLSAAALNGSLPEPTDPASMQTIEDPAQLEEVQAQAKQLQDAFDQAQPPPPEQQFEQLKPFIDLAKKIAGA